MNNQNYEKKENLAYKELILETLKKESHLFCPMRREKQFDFLFPKLEQDIKNGHHNILDLCCGYGRLIYFINQQFDGIKIVGLDYVEPLIEQAKSNFLANNNISLGVADAMNLPPEQYKKHDITIIYKTLSWLPYYETIIAEAMKATKHKIYITSLFWDGDIDFITKIHESVSDNTTTNFSYLNTYSLPKFTAYCHSLGAQKVQSTPMALDIDLAKNQNPNKLTTVTEKLIDGSRIELTGAVALNWKLIEIST